MSFMSNFTNLFSKKDEVPKKKPVKSTPAPMQQQQQTSVDDIFMPENMVQQTLSNDNSMPAMVMQQQQQTFDDFRPMGLGGVSIRELKFKKQKVNEDDEIVAIIVTICDGSTYDALFNQLPQQSEEGTRVKTYSCNSGAMRALNAYWNQDEEHMGRIPEAKMNVVRQLATELSDIDPECVVFNYECCSCYSEAGFKQEGTIVFIKTFLDKGFMVMCSDFSLKALIKEWDEELLGPKCLTQIGTFSDSFVLKFDSAVLTDCPSTQLQQVGELCNDGKASVHAMGGTIAYNVDLAIADNSSYTCEVLTVAQAMAGVNVKSPIHIGEETGGAGHVLLKYPSGGQLLTSAGHWMELSKLDVDVQRLLEVAQTCTKGDYFNAMSADISSSRNDCERREKTQKWAKEMIQQQSPCETTSGKRRKGKY